MNTISLGPVTVSDVQLLSRDPLPPPENPGTELLVPVTDIDLKAGEYERIRKSSGDVVWIPAGRKSTLLNATSDPERFIVLLFKTPAKTEADFTHAEDALKRAETRLEVAEKKG